jgi:hypothetical protein
MGVGQTQAVGTSALSSSASSIPGEQLGGRGRAVGACIRTATGDARLALTVYSPFMTDLSFAVMRRQRRRPVRSRGICGGRVELRQRL